MLTSSSLASACLNYYRDAAINACYALKDAVVSFYETHICPLMEAVSTFVVSATAFITINAIVPAGIQTPFVSLPAYVLLFPAFVDASRCFLAKFLAKIFPSFIARHMADHLVFQYATFQNWTFMIFMLLIVGNLTVILVKYLKRRFWD